MPGEAYKERIPYPYAVTYGWQGLPTTTKIVDLQREVKIGTQIMVNRVWWRVTELVAPGPGRVASRACDGARQGCCPWPGPIG